MASCSISKNIHPLTFRGKVKGKWDYLSLGEMFSFFFFRNFGCFACCGAVQYSFYLANNHKVSRNQVIVVWLCLWFNFFFVFLDWLIFVAAFFCYKSSFSRKCFLWVSCYFGFCFTFASIRWVGCCICLISRNIRKEKNDTF